MFNKNDKPETNGGSMTTTTSTKSSSTTNGGPILNIIGAGTTVEGTISCDGDIRIEGHVKGTVNSKAKIVIGSTGSVEGDLYCDNADISGKIFGSVEAKDIVFLKSSAYLEGDITTTKFVVETGAKFNGNCRMGVKEIKPTEKPVSKPVSAGAPTTTTLQKEAV
jgi:cytoskeletal protein CcmA (bactofilin family)